MRNDKLNRLTEILCINLRRMERVPLLQLFRGRNEVPPDVKAVAGPGSETVKFGFDLRGRQ